MEIIRIKVRRKIIGEYEFPGQYAHLPTWRLYPGKEYFAINYTNYLLVQDGQGMPYSITLPKMITVPIKTDSEDPRDSSQFIYDIIPESSVQPLFVLRKDDSLNRSNIK